MSSRRSALGSVSNRANRENVNPRVQRRTSGGGSSHGKRRASSRSALAPVSRRRYDDDEDDETVSKGVVIRVQRVVSSNLTIAGSRYFDISMCIPSFTNKYSTPRLDLSSIHGSKKF